jgi:hypothetical protein
MAPTGGVHSGEYPTRCSRCCRPTGIGRLIPGRERTTSTSAVPWENPFLESLAGYSKTRTLIVTGRVPDTVQVAPTGEDDEHHHVVNATYDEVVPN